MNIFNPDEQGTSSVSTLLSLNSMDNNLTIVLFGNTVAVQFQDDNILVGDTQPNIGNVARSRNLLLQKILRRHVSVINLIGLHESAHDLDQIAGQIVSENKIVAFVFVVELGQLSDAGLRGIEWLQSVFGDRVHKFVMILFTYENEDESDSIIDDLKKNLALEQLIEKCGGRYHTCSKIMNKKSDIRDLMKKIEQLFIDNNQQFYTSEMYNTVFRQDGDNRTSQDQTTSTEDSTDNISTTTTKQRHEGKKPSTHGERLNEKKNERSGEIKQLFHRLQLNIDEIDPSKLRAEDVLQLTTHSSLSLESCAEEELIHVFLQKLLMMNYRARYIKTKAEEQDDELQSNYDASEDESGVDFFEESLFIPEKTNTQDNFHPMDIQMAVFHCADSFLKQLMVTKLSQCQYALPLLVPDPFTQEIEFPLWTFRQINKNWKIKEDPNNEIISTIQPVWKAETPMVFFFRFGPVSSSKSQLMNNLINEKHNTFFHRNCSGSIKKRLLMDGVVEIAWYCPSGKGTGKFTQCVAFCNLHGDAGDHEKQMQILTEMASVNVIILPQLDKNDKSASMIQALLNDKKPLICILTENECGITEAKKGKSKLGLKGRNQSDVSEELVKAINKGLSFTSLESSSIFRLEDVSRYSGISIDEEQDVECKRGKEAAQHLMSLLTGRNLTRIKELFLPCQGKLWHQWCQKNKELHRSRGNEIDMKIKQNEMKKIREEQHALKTGDLMKLFIEQMYSEKSTENMFFLKWLTILLDEYTSADLSALHYEYDKIWKKAKAEQHTKDEHAELLKISKELQAATFGLEHIMREIGQIYESCKSENKNKSDLQCSFSFFPGLAADMMISGFPLELMDGDAAHVPVVWVTAVLHELIQKLGDQRVFVLSVLGIQSSGKSTMLNAMFGLQFAVSAGRCTRGAFMQLIRVSEEMKKEQLKFDYILVVDTEGLRAPKLAGRSTQHQDNELATFVVGLGNLTLINIFGENPSELQDVLQIVVQAFMRMKKVKLNPSCMFVHQNVSEISAGEKNMEGRRGLQETLDEMTKLAAKDEISDAKSFNDIINFDIQEDVKYFAQLWEGSPPMAPPNPSYCENIQELKQAFFGHASKSDGLELIHLENRVHDLWEALLNERFVFSFKNSLEIATYRKLETEYNKWSWSLRKTMLDVENKLHNKIENEALHEVSQIDLHGKLKVKSGEVEKTMSEFFENNEDKEILIQWKASFFIKIKELQENIVKETARKLNEILQQRDVKKKIDVQKTLHENTLFENSKELAVKLKDKANDETILKREFNSFWKECVKEITKQTPQIQNIDILNDMKQLLSNYESVSLNDWRNTDIFSVQCYSDYVQFKRSGGTTESAKLKIEAETQIRAFIDDIAHQADTKIQKMSYNIAKMGYNKTYIQELADYIKDRKEDFEQGSREYVFQKEFYLDLVMSICERENKLITDQHRKFREANDPVFYFEEKREIYYSIFQKYCQGATSAAIFGEIICQKLKEPIQKCVYKDTARDLANEIQTDCESLNGNRSKLEKHILKALAEQEDFDKYKNYITNPRDHFESFIRDEVNQYITDNFRKSVRPKMKQNIEHLNKKIAKAAQRATALVNKTGADVSKWLDVFTKQLSDMLIFSVKDFSGVSHDGVDDLNLLEDVISKLLDSLSNEIQHKFTTEMFLENLEPNDRPDQVLTDHLCQCCWVQCPFCDATCTNTIKNHTGDHSVPLHRVNGLMGCCYDETEQLSTDFCTTLVKSYKRFYTDQWFSCKEYRKAGGVYAEWHITPDCSDLPYWKWFVCRFRTDLQNYFGKTFHRWDQISEAWGEFTKKQAIQSLDKYI